MALAPASRSSVPLPRRPCGEPACHVALQVHGGLTVREARPLCDGVQGALATGARSLSVDLRDVTAVDAVGLAGLLQCHELAETLGVPMSVTVSPRVRHELVRAKLVEELTLASEVAPGAEDVRSLWPFGERAEVDVVARTAGIVLRRARPEDTRLFAEWARDPLVDQMVGSDLLYVCRHTPRDDATVVATIVQDPRAVTLVVETHRDPGRAIGYVRLYDVDLVSGFGFLETVIGDHRSLRRGIGIVATRLFLAYAVDVLRLRRVEAKVYGYNALSINALRRNGFQQEGVLRAACVSEGRAWDILVFSILEGEMARERETEAFPRFGLFSASARPR